jgi:hypothetical protein
MVKCPSGRATVLYIVPEGTCIAFTEAPARTSFLLFRMMPEIPELVTCAVAIREQKANSTASKVILFMLLVFRSTKKQHPPPWPPDQRIKKLLTDHHSNETIRARVKKIAKPELK